MNIGLKAATSKVMRGTKENKKAKGPNDERVKWEYHVENKIDSEGIRE